MALVFHSSTPAAADTPFTRAGEAAEAQGRTSQGFVVAYRPGCDLWRGHAPARTGGNNGDVGNGTGSR